MAWSPLPPLTRVWSLAMRGHRRHFPGQGEKVRICDFRLREFNETFVSVFCWLRDDCCYLHLPRLPPACHRSALLCQEWLVWPAVQEYDRKNFLFIFQTVLLTKPIWIPLWQCQYCPRWHSFVLLRRTSSVGLRATTRSVEIFSFSSDDNLIRRSASWWAATWSTSAAKRGGGSGSGSLLQTIRDWLKNIRAVLIYILSFNPLGYSWCRLQGRTLIPRKMLMIHISTFSICHKTFDMDMNLLT